HVALPGFVGLDPGIAGHAGGWLRTVLASAALAPAAFVALNLWRRTRRTPLGDVDSSPPNLPFAWVVAAFGVVLCAAGAINQAIRRPPIVVDLTLRTGNGGFVVLGVVLTGVGLTLWLTRHKQTGRVASKS